MDKYGGIAGHESWQSDEQIQVVRRRQSVTVSNQTFVGFVLTESATFVSTYSLVPFMIQNLIWQRTASSPYIFMLNLRYPTRYKKVC